MIKLPKWVLEIFEQSACPFEECKVKLVPSGVIAVGIREEKIEGSNKPILSFYYEYKCLKCKKRSQFTGFPTSMEDFIGDMLEIANINVNINGFERGKTKISVAELDEAKKLLRKSKNFKDFSGYFGILDVEPEDPNENK